MPANTTSAGLRQTASSSRSDADVGRAWSWAASSSWISATPAIRWKRRCANEGWDHLLDYRDVTSGETVTLTPPPPGHNGGHVEQVARGFRTAKTSGGIRKVDTLAVQCRC